MPGIAGYIDLNKERALLSQGVCPARGRYWRGSNSELDLPGLGVLMICGDSSNSASLAEHGKHLLAIGERIDSEWRSELQAQLEDDFVSALRSLPSGFVFCLTNENTREVIISVDQFGSFPIFYAESDRRIVFSSDLVALAEHPIVDRNICDQAIYNYLYFTAIPAPSTIYDSIQRIPPGFCLRISKTGHEIFRWYYPQPERRRTRTHFRKELSAALESAVKDRWAAGDTACFLSGGLDSSSVCGLASRVSCSKVPAFSIGFPELGYDEMVYARIARDAFALDHSEHYVAAEEIINNLEGVIAAFGEPFSNASAISTLVCARLVKEAGYDYVLAGDGGDELFAGNERYQKQLLLHRFQQFPRFLRESLMLLKLEASGRESRLLQKVGSYVLQGALPFAKRYQYNNFVEQSGADSIFSARFLSKVDSETPVRMIQDMFDASPFEDFVKRMLYIDWRITLADNDLRKVRVACEMAGVDVLFPMLDSRVVAIAEQIPGPFLMPRGKLRGFYKAAFKEILPAQIINKSKHGFGVPVGMWMHSNKHLNRLVRDKLNALAQRDIINPDFLVKMVKAHESEDAVHFGVVLWTLFVLELWMQQNGV